MSIKEFFAFSIIKPQVIEYLKNKGDFESLGAKYKKPFRGHIVREETNQMNSHYDKTQKFDSKSLNKNSPPQSKSTMGPFGTISAKNEKPEEKFYISDGFNQIACEFSPKCVELFREKYPESVKIEDLVNMLVCVYDYELILKTHFNDKSNIVDNKFFMNESAKNEGPRGGNGNNQHIDPKSLGQKQPVWQSTQMYLVLRIDNIKVISFDNFSIAAKQPIEFDDQVRKHLEFCLHHLFKRQLFEMTPDNKDYKVTSVVPEILEMNCEKFMNLTIRPISRSMLTNKKQQAYGLMKKAHQIENHQRQIQKQKNERDIVPEFIQSNRYDIPIKDIKKVNSKDLSPQTAPNFISKADKNGKLILVSNKSPSGQSPQVKQIGKKLMKRMVMQSRIDGFVSVLNSQLSQYGQTQQSQQFKEIINQKSKFDLTDLNLNKDDFQKLEVEQQELIDQLESSDKSQDSQKCDKKVVEVVAEEVDEESNFDDIDLEELGEALIDMTQQSQMLPPQSQAKSKKAAFNHKDLNTQNNCIPEEIDDEDSEKKNSQISEHTDPDMINLLSQQNNTKVIESQQMASQNLKDFEKQKNVDYQDMLIDTPEDDKVKLPDILEVRGGELISNPSSPIENEKILLEIEERQNKDRIELDIKDPVVSKKSQRVQVQQNEIVGMGLNLQSKQQAYMEFKVKQKQSSSGMQNSVNPTQHSGKTPVAQGQGEQKSSPYKSLSQIDILDTIDDGKPVDSKNAPPKIIFDDKKVKHTIQKNGILADSSSSEVQSPEESLLQSQKSSIILRKNEQVQNLKITTSVPKKSNAKKAVLPQRSVIVKTGESLKLQTEKFPSQNPVSTSKKVVLKQQKKGQQKLTNIFTQKNKAEEPIIMSNEVEQISDEVDLKELMKYNKKKGKGLVGTKRTATAKNLTPVKQDASENVTTPNKSSKKKADKTPVSIEKKILCEDQKPQRNLAKTKTSKICAPNSESQSRSMRSSTQKSGDQNTTQEKKKTPRQMTLMGMKGIGQKKK